MCRLFCRFSASPHGIAEPLKEGPFSLVHLSTADRRRRQSDGWGVGWIERNTPRVIRSPGEIYREPKLVTKAIQAVFSSTTVGHIRRASNPLKLPKKSLIGIRHCQPFSHGPWLFCHNGTLAIPREVKAELGPWKRFVKSKNDSEVLFYWILKTFAAGRGSPAARLRRSMKQLDAIWRRCRTTHPDLRYPVHGVNWVLTDGKQLFAFCYVNPEGFRQGGALAHKKQPYFALQVRLRQNSIDVASEAWDSDPKWKSLGHGVLLVAKRQANRLSATRSRIL
jgi:predicted glutamine amidotransferase